MQSGFIVLNNAHPFLDQLSSVTVQRGSQLKFTARKNLDMKETGGNELLSSSLRSSAKDALSSTVSLLSQSETGIFNARRAESSNPSVLTAEAANGAAEAGYSVQVYQLASGQDVVSDKLTANAQNVAGGGIFSFTFNRNNQEYRFEVTSGQTDTNEQLLNNVADTINAADVGIKASVETSDFGQTARLRVTGVTTGSMNSFTLTDESRNLLQSIGLSTAYRSVDYQGGLVQSSGDAIFSVNGTMFVSDSNKVSLFENSVEFTFKKTTSTPSDATDLYNLYRQYDYSRPGVLGSSPRGGGGLVGNYMETINMEGASASSVTVTIKPDETKAAQGIASFMSASGNLVNKLRQSFNPDYRAVANYISGQFSRVAGSLASLGLEKQSGSYQVTDTEKLYDKLSNSYDSVKNLFVGPGGLADKTFFGIQRAAYAPQTGISWVHGGMPPSTAATGFFHDIFA